jgi:two-component system, NtrC family, response regulator GlrR
MNAGHMHKRDHDRRHPTGLEMETSEPDPMKVTMSMPVLKPPMPARSAAGQAEAGDAEQLDSHIIVIDGRDAGRTFVASHESMVIGEHPSADVVLKDPTVSRFHCEITLGSPATVRDLGSKNGTVVNGVRVDQAPLEEGAILTLGNTKLRFQRAAASTRIPLSGRDRFGQVVGQSAAMRSVFALCEQAAASDATALIEGETGTGKEATAEAIHKESVRGDGPFIIVDCGAIPPQLLESELFGHERGAFTGAVNSRKGAFQAASGGTIVLDEIGELGLELQPKLLRVLERREVKPVGGNHYAPVDVRVLAATNRNLREEVTARRFRSDLYYRLAVLRIRIPPLRERKEDLPLLLDHFLQTLGPQHKSESRALRSPDFMAELQRHAWPGNIRELRNYIERCLATRAQPSPQETELGASISTSSEGGSSLRIDIAQPLKSAREAWVSDFERRYLAEILRHHDDNITVAARAAGVDRIHFYRLLWKHGLRSRDPASSDK